MIEAISEKTIKLLLDSTDPVTSKTIALEIGMSESSVKHNMKEVRHIISTTNAILKSMPGKGFWIEASDQQRKVLFEVVNENRDKAYSFNYRRNYILDILFQENSEYTIQIFADDLGVGRNVIIKDLESIEKWLGFFDIQMIRIRNKGIIIKGGEFDIRQAIIYNNTSLMDTMEMDLERPDDLDFRVSGTFYNYFSKVYIKNDIYQIQDILLNAERELDYHFEDVSFIQLMEYITVSFNRIKKERLVLENNILNKCKITLKEFEAAKHLIQSYIGEMQAYLSIEYRCMAAQFSLYGTYEEAANSSFIKEEYYEYEARDFVERLQAIILNKKILINDNLISDISLLFKKKKLQKSYQIMNSNYLKRDIKKHLPSLYAIVLANIQPLEHSLNVKFTENDIAYFVMLIDNAMEDTIDEVSILLITSFDYNTAKYLENKIKRSIRHIKIEKVIHLEEIEKEDLSHYDVVLTTVLLDIEGIIKISRRVDTFDLDLIYKEVKHKRSMKQKIITREEQLFKLDLICNDFKAKRKEDVFEKAVKLLSQQGYTTEAFYDVLLQRENFVSTAIGNGVAIPHGYKSEILKSGIAVIKLDRAIDWNETEKVEIVFIIAIEMDSRKEIYEFFAKFYALIDDQEKLDKIKSAKNKEEIFMAIQDIGAITRE